MLCFFLFYMLVQLHVKPQHSTRYFMTWSHSIVQVNVEQIESPKVCLVINRLPEMIKCLPGSRPTFTSNIYAVSCLDAKPCYPVASY